MKIIFKKYRLLIPILLLAGPFIDMLNGLFIFILNSNSNVNPGVLIRSVIFLVLIYCGSKSNHRFIYVFFASLAILFVGSGYHLIMGSDVDLYQSVNRFTKALLPFVGFAGILYLDSKARIENKLYYWKLGYYYGLITVVGIVIFTVFDISVTTYRYQDYSSKGILKAQNDTSLIIMISYCIFLGFNYFNKNSTINLIVVTILYFTSAFYLSTRSVLIGLPVIFTLFQMYLFVTRTRSNKLSNKVFSVILVFALSVAIVQIVEFWINNDVNYLLRKFEELQEGDFRRSVPEGIEMIMNYSVLEHLFGIGDAEFALTENDVVDLYGKFGLILLSIVVVMIMGFYFRTITSLLKSRQLSYYLLVMAMSVYLIHGSLAGHAFASSQVNSLMIIVYFIIYKEREHSRRALTVAY